MDWDEEQIISFDTLSVQAVSDLELKLKRQGFVAERENDTNLYNGFHRKADGLYWYKFKVDEDAVVYKREFLIAWGLCSQAAGVTMSGSDKNFVRFLNPGGTCV